MQTYFENDYLTIWYDKANHLLIHKWMVGPSSDEFRNGLNSVIPAVEHFKTGKIITDTTDLGAISEEDQTWAATEWFQNALKVGYSQLAVIIPANVFTQMSVKESINQAASDLPSAYFDNMEAAIAWMKKF